MSYYNNYRGQRSSTYSNTAGAQPKRLLPDQLHNVFRIELHRLNNKREICETDGMLFDSDIEQQSSSSTTPASTSTSDTILSNTHKYTLQPVFIGEIWRFRLKLSNKLNETLHNFGLLCHIEQNEKGNGSPIQLYPRPRELCPTQLAKQDNICIDLEYPVTSNVPASYSLILTITASNQDESQQLYKDVFEFHAVPCVALTYQKQTLEENLFVEALLHNVSNQPSMALSVHVHFKCMDLFKAYNLTHHNTRNTRSTTDGDDDGDDGSVHLAPAHEKNELFQIEMKNPTSLVNLNALSVGKIEVRWWSAQAPFREGMFLSDLIQRRSLFCRKLDATSDGGGGAHGGTGNSNNNIEILILKCPSSSMVHCAFTVTFHIFNLDRCAREIWLRIDKNTSGYLLPCNLSRKYLGVVDTSSSIKTGMTLIALVPGIHVLTGIVIETRAVSKFTGSSSSSAVSSSLPIKSVHYEIYFIDIDEKFHARKMKERQEKERWFLQQQQQQQQQDENGGEAEGVQQQIADIKIGNEQKEKEKEAKTPAATATETTAASTIETKTETETEEKMNIDDSEDMLPVTQPQTRHRQSMEFARENGMDIDLENESSDMIRPSPTHKPAIPESSDMKPIGHQKSAAEIEQERMASALAMDDAGDDDEDVNGDEDGHAVEQEEVQEEEEEQEEKEKAVADEDGGEEEEEKVKDDDMDIAPLEIAMQNATLATADEHDQVMETEKHENDDEEEEENEEFEETPRLSVRHLAAKDPANQSMVSVNTVNDDSNVDERTDDEKEHTDGDQQDQVQEDMQ
eukprot:CAMPEP_0202731374 /NCGR_PEP_ID=MMETSP1385-20130828/187116_1 /ASSEMBLY_ACC=CAM_ASM_000861 /TAXON_ID=933848 /ORGANISM="Elphidium margaritaceum" /LENGTH=795 /DNA_ID=CAMNT_0049397671 /DNA_START=23 /DNA_END=2411 /DNA_ORIENTATION=+